MAVRRKRQGFSVLLDEPVPARQPPDPFLTVSDEIQEFYGSLKIFEKSINDLGTSRDTSQFRYVLMNHRNKFTQMQQQIISKLLQLRQQISDNSPALIEKLNILEKENQKALDLFHSLLHQLKILLQKHPKPVATATPISEDEEQIRQTSPNQVQLQQLQFVDANLIDADESDALLVKERNEEMKRLATEMGDLKELYVEVAQKVDEATEPLQQVEEKTLRAEEVTDKAVQELLKAHNLDKDSLMLKAAGIGAAAGLALGATLGIASVFFTGPGAAPLTVGGAATGIAVGSAGGTAVGAALGGVSGKIVGRALKTQAHEELFNHENHSNPEVRWVNDDEVSACQRCSRKFHKLRRKHHCRKCGRVFCSKCAGQFGAVDVKRVDYGGEVRLCVDCFYGRELTTVERSKQEKQEAKTETTKT